MTVSKCARCDDALESYESFHVDFSQTVNRGWKVCVKTDKYRLCEDCYTAIKKQIEEPEE